MTITIELPDTPAIRERILPLSDAERSHAIADLVMRYLLPPNGKGDVAQDEEEEEDYKLTAEDLAVLKLSIADGDDGRGRDGDSVLADLRIRVGRQG